MSTNRPAQPAAKAKLPAVAVTTATLPAVVLSSLALAQPAAAAPAPEHVQEAFTAARSARQAEIVPASEIAAMVPSRLAPSLVPAAPPAPADYTVVNGDTVIGIASRYGLDWQQVLKLNGLEASSLIFPGQKLRLTGDPVPSISPASAAPADSAPAPSGGSYQIKPGDTLYGIASKLHVPLGDLLAANGLSLTSVIYAGRSLKLPAPAIAPASSVTPSSAAPAKPLVGSSFLGFTYPDAVVASANENKRILNASPVPDREQAKQIVADTARRMGVDPALALALAYHESGFSQRAVSPANAIGLMQIVPSSAQWASDLVGRKLNPLDPRDNATAGIAILRALLASSPSQDLAIAGYYQGQSSVAKRGMFDDTKDYVAAINANMNLFR
ncbi:LysM peptidoglycan-binding domain-containing protein [Sinomonas sp. JGH33]|uniref:LysM peptidoglycan-binding domain-containing protein n=1 Tax=Sinomonas terricola TaxID=3110330 RepID=A0ABU5TB01_9MICC|nr:LysM peptidoglycan-binding domain-containing protein [Sinomonas sp. JGH33]MEA5456872.1 LysM peptidoglycan-binding domain-containing protein [Sinomonas sp. JGH33]